MSHCLKWLQGRNQFRQANALSRIDHDVYKGIIAPNLLVRHMLYRPNIFLSLTFVDSLRNRGLVFPFSNNQNIEFEFHPAQLGTRPYQPTHALISVERAEESEYRTLV